MVGGAAAHKHERQEGRSLDSLAATLLLSPPSSSLLLSRGKFEEADRTPIGRLLAAPCLLASDAAAAAASAG